MSGIVNHKTIKIKKCRLWREIPMKKSASLFILTLIAAALWFFTPSIPPAAAADNNPRLTVVEENGKYGYIDETGKLVIEKKYDFAAPFTEGLAKVKSGGKWGFIDEKGEFAIEPKYESTGQFREGLAYAELDGKACFIDKKGTVVLKKEDDWLGPLSCGLIRFNRDGKQGYLDLAGKVAIEPKFKLSTEFSEDAAYTKDKDGFYYFDKKGAELFPGKRFAEVSDFNDGLALVVEKGKEEKKYGFIDKTGKFAIEPAFLLPACFSEGLAFVNKDGKRLFIDKTGKEAFPLDPKISAAAPFSEGLSIVRSIAGKVGAIDKTGKFVIEMNIEDIEANFFAGFLNGLAALRRGDGSKIFIDRSGKVVFGKSLQSSKQPEVGKSDPSKQPEGCRENMLALYNAFISSNPSTTFIEITATSCVCLAKQEYSVSELLKAGVLKKEVKDSNNNVIQAEKCVCPSDPKTEYLLRVINPPVTGGNELVLTGAETVEIFCPTHKKTLREVETENKSVYLIDDLNSENPEGLYMVKNSGKFGFISCTGEILQEPCFDSVQKLFGRYRIASYEGKLGLLDNFGTTALEFEYDSIGGFFNDKPAQIVKKGKKGLVSATGEIVLEPVYDNIDDCGTAGIYIVQKKDLYGLYDKEGCEIAKPEYEMIGGFSEEGLAAVCRKKKYGYIDTEGNVVIGIKYEKANEFYHGIAEVSENGRTFKIDKNGDEIKE